jgi:hypothetical protein
LFAKLAKKYDAVNPLDSTQQTIIGEGRTTVQGSSSMTDDSSTPMESVKSGNGGIASFNSQQQIHDHSSSVPSHGMSTSSFGSPLNATNLSVSMPLSSQVGLSTPFSAFGQSLGSSPPPTVSVIGSSFIPTPSFGGKSPRELLTAFYQEKNPSKIADVDSLLIKYQVRKLAFFTG